MKGLVRGNQTEFDAQAKRSYFGLRESLRGTRSRGSIWLSAKVNLNGNTVRISTNEWVEEFKVAHAVHKGPRIVFLSGFEGVSAKRRTVKFSTVEDAEQAVATISSYTDVREEYQPDQSFELETPVQIQSLIPKTLPLFLVPLPLILIVGFISLIYGPSWLFSLLLPPLIVAFLGYRVFLWGFTLFSEKIAKSSNRELSKSWLSHPINGWLKVQDGYFVLKTSYDWTPYQPLKVEWRDSRSFVMRTKGVSMLLSFFKEQDAIETVSKLRNESPGVEEVFLKGYQSYKAL